MLDDEKYWHGRALSETTAALRCNDARIAALHVELATQCVRQALAERDREIGEPRSSLPAS